MNSTSAQVRRHNVSTTTKPHFAYLDIAKAIGILMVVFAHINTDGTELSSIFYRNFYSFHIPLFFILSGMTFKYKGISTGKFLANKAKRLLLPYLSYSLITFIWYATVELKMPEFDLSSGQSMLGSFIEIFLARGSVKYLQHNPALWFIPCLFVTHVIYYFVCKCKTGLKVTLSIVLGIIGYVFTLNFMPTLFRALPWQLGVAFLAIPFMLIGEGFTCKLGLEGFEKLLTEKKVISWIYVIISIVVIALLTKVNGFFLPLEAKGHVSMGSKYIGNIAIFYLNATIGTMMVLTLSALLAGIFKERIALHKSALVWLGERSYAIMAIHFPVKRRMVVLVAQAIDKWQLAEVTGGFTKYTSGSLLASFIAFLFTMVITIIITIAADAFMKNMQLPFHKKEDRQV